jgi:hypothetical protein
METNTKAEAIDRSYDKLPGAAADARASMKRASGLNPAMVQEALYFPEPDTDTEPPFHAVEPEIVTKARRRTAASIRAAIMTRAEYRDDADYCEHGLMYCEICDSPCVFGHHDIRPEDDFCHSCGKEL